MIMLILIDSFDSLVVTEETNRKSVQLSVCVYIAGFFILKNRLFNSNRCSMYFTERYSMFTSCVIKC